MKNLIPMLARNLIQIAGVLDEAEAEMLQRCGVNCLGFPLRLPVHREDISEERASKMIRRLRAPAFGVLITYLHDAQQIVEFCTAVGTRVVQLHGAIELEELVKLKSIAPQLLIIKSLVVGLHSEDTLAAMVERFSNSVDAFITDTYEPTTGASGATGKMHDWGISRRLVEMSNRPVILAGGLGPENVRRAIAEVRPAGVDAHTGVEDETGRKCRRKVASFIAEARAGFRLMDDGAYG
jgi:phosphoribosylanthranilate isomerase